MPLEWNIVRSRMIKETTDFADCTDQTKKEESFRASTRRQFLKVKMESAIYSNQG